jgi:hypothetical protein
MAITPAALKAQVDAKVTELTTIYQSMPDATSGEPVLLKDEIRTLKAEKQKADRAYEEEIARRETLGGKTRQQTLQEFVILFFFVSFGLLVVSTALQAGVVEGRSASIKIIGIGLLLTLFIAAFVVRYA